MSIVIEARDLTLGYGGRIAVAESDFVVPGSAVTAVIGANGSGKSTLLHAIAGALPVRSGSLSVLGRPPGRARRRVSYVLQSVAVPTDTPISVLETVGMGRYATLGVRRRRRREDRERVASAMREMGVSDLAKRHLTELSTGQRQRVYVAQGLAQDHDLLLLDEPTTGLDLNSTRAIEDVMSAERDRGGAVLVSTHDLELALAADHVVLLSGRVVAAGPPHEVLTDDNLDLAYGRGARRTRPSTPIDDPHHDDAHHEAGTAVSTAQG